MKIKISEVKPGMVIKSDRYRWLVFANKQQDEFDVFWGSTAAITLYNSEAYSGRCCQEVPDPDALVTVQIGEKRAKVIAEIQKSIRKHMYDLQEDISIISILSMVG